LQLWANAVSQGAKNITSTSTSTSTITVGAYLNGTNPSERFNGSVDDVRIYNRALSAAEILAIYETSQRRDDPTLNWLVRRTYSFAKSGLLLKRRRALCQ
jgi:hypothetical protein